MKVARKDARIALAGGLALIVLAGASTVAAAASEGAFRHRWASPSGQCSAPDLPLPVVNVTLTNMGGAMMQGAAGGMMRIVADKRTLTNGTVSLRVANTGSLVHELIVLPLPAGRRVGDRAVGANGRLDETGSAGEVSRTCGAGVGDGIAPGAIGWVTLHLAPGLYELICNLAGHYAAGMYTELIVA